MRHCGRTSGLTHRLIITHAHTLILFLRFFKEPQLNGSQRSAKEALLLWCQNKTRGYANVDVKDFTTSWRDGLAFGALLHSHEPEAIDMSKMRPDKPIENLTIAFKAAEQCFEVPQMLDPQGMPNALQ